MSFVKLIGWSVIAILSLIVLVAVVVAGILFSLPKVSELNECLTTTMFEVKLCPGSPHYVKLSDIAPMVGHAVIASEDAAFYSHHGFDWYEIQQSVKTDLQTGKFRRGGSTMTQQLAKNIWLTKDKSLLRKFKEAYLTYQLEQKFTKDVILEKYLNVVQFSTKVFGVKDAAQYYFKKHPSQLHVLEATYLAFLLPNPEVYGKGFGKGQLTPFSKKIISIILKRLVQFKKITPAAYHFAVSQIDAFPWSGLTQADFNNATGTGTEVIPVGDDDLDQLWNENAPPPPDDEPKASPRSAPSQQPPPEELPVEDDGEI